VRLLERKLKNADEITKLSEELKRKKKRIAFTNGCFDIVHAGHVTYLEEASRLADVLIVGLNSDESVKRLKGETRPIIPQQERAKLLCALESVDYVVIFNEDTPERLIRAIKPHLLVKGADWKGKTVAGCDFVRSYGGECLFVELVEGLSTSAIIERIIDVYCGSVK